MAELTSSELRIVTGIAAKNLFNYRSRGHIVQNIFKKYDLSNETNKAFIEQYGIPGQLELVIEKQNVKPLPKIINPKIEKVKVEKLKKIVKPKKKIKDPTPKQKEPKKLIPKPEPKPKLKKETKPKPEKVKTVHIENELSELTKVNLRQKEISIKKSEAEMKLKELELLQKQNSLIELERVVNISKAYADNLSRGLLQTIKTFVQDICARHNIESGKTGEYKMKVADLINKSNEKAIQELLKEFGE